MYLSKPEKQYIQKLVEKDQIINKANIGGNKNIAFSDEFGSPEAKLFYEKRLEELVTSNRILNKLKK